MRRKGDPFVFPVNTRLDRPTMDRLVWYCSQRSQPMSVVMRDMVIESLDTYMNSATVLGQQYTEERQAHQRMMEERTVKHGLPRA